MNRFQLVYNLLFALTVSFQIFPYLLVIIQTAQDQRVYWERS